MRIIKRILVVLLLLILAVAITGIFTQKDYGVEREIVINKPKEEVFAYLKMLKNQSEYSVWQQRDPKMKKKYSGEDGNIGFVSAWESKNDEVGAGEQEIKKIIEGQRIETELRFKEPFEATDLAYMETDMMSENVTKVRWGFKGRMEYPSNIMMLFMDFEGMLGKDLQEGLNKLKIVLEKR